MLPRIGLLKAFLCRFLHCFRTTQSLVGTTSEFRSSGFPFNVFEEEPFTAWGKLSAALCLKPLL